MTQITQIRKNNVERFTQINSAEFERQKSKIKTILICISICLGLSSNAKENDLGKLANPFQINSRTIDASLVKGTSKFVLNFKSNGIKYVETVAMGFNEREFSSKPDTNGTYKYLSAKGKYKLYLYIEGYLEVITDSIDIKSQEVIEADVNFQLTNDMIIVFKPVIYVYPLEKTEVEIKLNVNGNLGFTYPLYNEGWKFTATPDGNITLDGKDYNYLFWESEMPGYALDRNDKTGFLVATDTLLPFLESSLSQMGFNSKESADFITFWYPRMMVNEKNFVKFLFNESCDAYAELSISPKPDAIFRVGMVWTEAKMDFVPEKQKISTYNRTGFTVIEWGGMIDPLLFTNEN